VLRLIKCSLSSLPTLSQLTQLAVLDVSSNPAVDDPQPGLRDLTTLKALWIFDHSCINEHVVQAVRGLPARR